MATITISDKNYQYLVQKATLLNSSPEAIVDELLETFLDVMMPAINAVVVEAPPIKTLGDLFNHGYGLWAERDD